MAMRLTLLLKFALCFPLSLSTALVRESTSIDDSDVLFGSLVTVESPRQVPEFETDSSRTMFAAMMEFVETLCELAFHSKASYPIDVNEEPEEKLKKKLGWDCMPLVIDRALAENTDPSDAFLLYCSPACFSDLLEIDSENALLPSDLHSSDISVRWPWMVERLTQMYSGSIESYETLRSRYSALLQSGADLPTKALLELKQIAKDSIRSGFRDLSFDDEYSREDLSVDCKEICGVYALVKEPVYGYTQGMIDLCMMLKLKGRMQNDEVFYGLTMYVESVIDLNVADGSTLTERAFVLVQLYMHLFVEMENLEKPTVFERISIAFVEEDQQPIGHELGNKFDQFLLSGGIRGNPGSQVGQEEVVPIADFVLLNGRPGLIAIFLANLSINLSVLESLMEKQGGHYEASRIFGNPFATGSACTVESLIEKANQYLMKRVGEVSFPRAIAIIDAYGKRLVSPSVLLI